MKFLLVVLLSIIVIVYSYQFDKSNLSPRSENDENKNSRIVGGLASVSKWIPYQVGLFLTNGTASFRCGGSLVDRNLIITAAHCLVGTIGAEVSLGSVTYRAGIKINVTPANYFIYPGYVNGSFVNDLALILLPTPVTLSDTIQTIDLVSEDDINESFAGNWSVVSGWGLTSDSSTVLPTTLQYKVVRALSNPDCSNSFSGQLNVLSSYICVESSGCSGDSGGPMVINSGEKLILVGVLSFGAGGLCEQYPAVYTRLTSFLSWIKLYEGLAKNLL